MTELSVYVAQLRRQGYSDEYIRDYLSNQGYTAQQIEDAMRRAGGQDTVKHEHHVSKSAIVFIILLLAVSGGVVYGVLKFTGTIGSKEVLLDLELTPETTTVTPGSELGYKVDVTNMGDAKEFDVTLNYEIFQGERQVDSRQETLAVSTSLSRDKSMPAPTEPGRYTLEAVAVYGEKTASSSFTFTVRRSEEKKQQISAEEKLDQVKEISTTQPSEAEELCLELQSEEKQDDCLSLVVKKSDRPEFCDKINNAETRDNCYMSYIVDGQTQLCSKVTLNSSKDYCSRMKDVQILANYESNR